MFYLCIIPPLTAHHINRHQTITALFVRAPIKMAPRLATGGVYALHRFLLEVRVTYHQSRL